MGPRGVHKAINTQKMQAVQLREEDHGISFNPHAGDNRRPRAKARKKKGGGELWKRHAAFRSAKRAHKRSNRHNIFFTAILAGLMLCAIYAYDGGSKGTRWAVGPEGDLEEFDFLGYRRLGDLGWGGMGPSELGRRLEEEVSVKFGFLALRRCPAAHTQI